MEAAIIFTALMLLIFGILQFAQIFWTWNTIMLAIEEGGRYAMVYNSTQNPNAACLAANPPPQDGGSCSAYPVPANCAQGQINNILNSYPSPVFTDPAFKVSLSCTVGSCGAPPPSNPPTLTIQGTFSFNFIMSTLFPYGPITITPQYTVPLC